MDILEAIRTRRSIRKYTADPVSEADLRELLEAAMSAPSAGNEQPWEFIVIDDRETLDAIPAFHPYAAMLKQAPAAILICGDLEREKYRGFWVQDCSAAIENLLLAAHGKGLGAVWLGVYPVEDRVAATRELFGLPPHVVPLAFIALGHPAEEKGPADRYNETRVHHNRFGNLLQ